MADEESKTSQDAGEQEEITVTTTGNTEDILFDKEKQDAKAKETETEEKAEETKAEEKKPEEKKAEEKTEKTEEKKVEEKYDIKLPEGSLLDKGAIERTVAFAKERGLTTKDAQDLLDRESKLLGTHVQSQQEKFKAMSAEWVEQVKADKEIGGDAFAENAELAKRVVSRYGSKELRDGLNETGFGNHPDLVKMFVRIGKAMSEDQLVMPGKQASGEKDMADVFYDNTKK